jgi:cell division protease FtsH
MGGLGLAPYAGGVPAGAAADDEDDDAKKDKKTFDDVAGCEEAIAKLKRVRKWLKYPKWYSLFKAKIPKGVLLVGPPGTGKTLLGQALAGETDANYFSISASEFVEMYVGVGASRVRKIFDQAIAARKKNGKPSIIFIDELDAVGKKRSGRGGGGDSERDQTLNQLLTCMQGFKPSSGILVIAATNLAETLDPALLRPGRFDYHVSVAEPDVEGREKIFSVHTRGMPLAKGISLRALAIRTPGMVGAHIELVCSEAGVIAAERQEHLTEGKTEAEYDALPREVTNEDFDAAIDFVQFGDELLSRMRNQTEDDKYNTCVHEAGHAVIATATGGDPVTKITRAIRSKSLGMMQAHSENTKYGLKEMEMRARIMTALGGQAAQLEFLDFKDTGASNDFEQANRLARYMVGAYGMSELGPIQLKLDDQGFPAVPLSPYLATRFDKAWTKLMAELWEETKALVKEHHERIERIAKALLAEETILQAKFRKLYDGTVDEPEAAEQPAGEGDGKSIPDATGYSL